MRRERPIASMTSDQCRFIAEPSKAMTENVVDLHLFPLAIVWCSVHLNLHMFGVRQSLTIALRFQRYPSMQWLKTKVQAVVSREDHSQAVDACTSCDNPCSKHLQYPEAVQSKVDMTGDMRSSIKPYWAHAIICTGLSDWPQKIESDKKGLAYALTKGTKGQRVRVSACDDPGVVDGTCDILLFPHALRLRKVVPAQVPALVAKYFTNAVPTDMAAAEEESGGSDDDASAATAAAPDETKMPGDLIAEPLDVGLGYVFVCTHKMRDKRCGVLGLILAEQFQKSLRDRQLDGKVTVRKISHVGGHKYAGNIILYPSGDWVC